MCNTTLVPAASHVAGAMVNCPAPSDAQVNASSDPALRDHERGIEADAELADQAGALLRLGGRKGGTERASAGAGDGAEIVDQLLPSHADTFVGDQQGARLLIGYDPDLRFSRRSQGAVGEWFEAAPIHRIGGIGHQLAQEYFTLGIERMDHQIEQPPDLGTKVMLFRHRIVHRRTSYRPRYAVNCGAFQCGGAAGFEPRWE
jgi:hypothetical protein